MQLGFEGMYRMRGLEQLQALQVDLRTQIADSRNRVPRTLSPHGVAAGSFMDKVQREVPYWVIAVVSVALIFFTYLLYVFLLSNKADTVREILQSDGQRIELSLDREKSPTKTQPPIVEEPPKATQPPKPKEEKHKKMKAKLAAPPQGESSPPRPKQELKPEPESKPKIAPRILRVHP
jgi:type IV secretory pathway VirB10-like protein